jgi:hypothetical protein
MNFCEKYDIDMLKIIIIIIGYTMNNFTYSCNNIIIDHGKFNNFQILKTNFFIKKISICFVDVETDPRLW